MPREQREALGGGGPSAAPAASGEAGDTIAKVKVQTQSLSGGMVDTEKTWKRPPNKTGQGATHVKSFHSKLTGESLAFLDKQINDWLDAHPELEVKLVTTSVGEWMGKLKEDNLIVQVWV